MRHTDLKQWMPDSYNGGDINFRLDKDCVEVTIERGMSDWMGCTKTAKFKIALKDVTEFCMGLSLFVNPTPPSAKRDE